MCETHSFVLSVVYFPGSSDQHVLESFRGDLHLLQSLYPEHIIAGDLSSRHRQWNCSRANSAGRILYNVTSVTDLWMHFPPTPTHFPENGGTPSTLDLLLVRGSINVSDLVTYNDLSSDHHPVHCSISATTKKLNTTALAKDYENANWPRFQQIIQEEIDHCSCTNISRGCSSSS